LGSDTTFTIDLHGSGGTPVVQGTVASISATTNQYKASYTATQAKAYELFVKHSNDNIMSSPYTMSLYPAITCGTMSSATGTGLTAATTTSISVFTIQARDEYSNLKTQGGDTFVARVVRTTATTGPNNEQTGSTRSAATKHAVVTSNSDGTYSGRYIITADADKLTHFHGSWAVQYGLMATYYDGQATTLASVINDDTILAAKARRIGLDKEIDWSSTVACSASPYCHGVTSGDVAFAVRWAGFVQITETGPYTFKIDSVVPTEERIRLWIDNLLLIDDWATVTQGASPTGSYSFDHTGLFDINIDYAASAAHSRKHILKWTTPSVTETLILSGSLFQRHDVAGSPYRVYVST